MTIETVCAKLGIPSRYADAIGEEWEASTGTFQLENTWMSPRLTEELSAYCNLDSGASAAVVETSRAMAENEYTRRLAWLGYWRLAEKTGQSPDFSKWPNEEAVPGIGRYYLLMALSIIPKVREVQREMGIPDDITRDTCLQVSCFNKNHMIACGAPGILPSQLSWLTHYIQGRLFRLGRMEYMLQPSKGIGTVLRNRMTGKVLLIAPDGSSYDRKGYVDNTKERQGSEGWKTVFKIEDGFYKGFPVSPWGYVQKKEVSMPLSEWDIVLRDGDMAIDMHIPSGGKMDLNLCLDSMSRAFNFFARYFPDSPSDAIICKSWIFNTQLEEKLPDSNLSKLMRELYLFPVQSSGRDGFFFVFLKDYPDLSKAPKNTSLQRTMLEILDAGGQLRSGGMFFLKGDLENFGTQHYRKISFMD